MIRRSGLMSHTYGMLLFMAYVIQPFRSTYGTAVWLATII